MRPHFSGHFSGYLLQGVLLLPLLGVFGCSTGSSTASAPPNPLLQTLPGNWQMEVQGPGSSPADLEFALLGELSVEGSTVSGIFQIPSLGPLQDTPCTTNPPQTVSLSGSIGEGDLLTLTSASFLGSVATLQLQLPLTGLANNLAKGSVAIAGGDCAFPSTPVSAIHVPPLNGTYAGTFSQIQVLGQPASGPAIPATIAYTQSATANADGQFPLSANVSLTSTSCTFSATITGIVTGLTVQMFSGSPGYSSTVPGASLSGGALISPTELGPQVLIVGTTTGSCPQGLYRGSTFTLQ